MSFVRSTAFEGLARSYTAASCSLNCLFFCAKSFHYLCRDLYLLDLIGNPRTIDFKGGQYPNYGASMDVYPWETGRLRRVTEMVAQKSGWGKRNHGKGTGIGIAAHRSFLTYVATVVEVEVDDQGEVRIPRVDTVLDAGLVVNPEATSSPVRRRRGIRHKYCAKRRDYGDQGRHRPIEFSGLSGGSDCRGALSDECIHRRW